MQVINAHEDIAEMLKEAANGPTAAQLEVIYNGTRHDLFEHKDQLIFTGQLIDNRISYADELLLKFAS